MDARVMPVGGAPPSAPVLSLSEPQAISQSVRDLLGPSPFRTASEQVTCDQIRGMLVREFRVQTFMQAELVDRLATVIVERRQLERTIQTVVDLALSDAAREILLAGYSNFVPLKPGVAVMSGSCDTAYSRFMSEGGDYIKAMSDQQAIAEALADLAVHGLSEDALRARARMLRLGELERLERMLATKAGEQESLISNLLEFIDRRERKGLAKQGS